MSEDRSLWARGAYISADACFPVWQVLQRYFQTAAARDGVRPSRPVQEAMVALRQAAMAYGSSPSGQGGRTSADTVLASVPERQVYTTEEFAGLLKVSDRHARRIAANYQVVPVARGLWDRDSVNYVLACRSGREGVDR
jgi:hypothetical protein